MIKDVGSGRDDARRPTPSDGVKKMEKLLIPQDGHQLGLWLRRRLGLVLVGASLGLSACGPNPDQVAADRARTGLMGMTLPALMACAGPPAGANAPTRAKSGATA